MRSTIARTPFDRCGVKCVSRPSSRKAPKASVAQNLLGRLIGEEGDGDGDQSAHEMRVAVAAVVEDRSARRVGAFLPLQPDLADAAPHLVGVVMRFVAQGLEAVTEFDHVTITILPLIEQGEIVADRTRTETRRTSQPSRRAPYKRIAANNIYSAARQRPKISGCRRAGPKNYASEEPCPSTLAHPPNGMSSPPCGTRRRLEPRPQRCPPPGAAFQPRCGSPRTSHVRKPRPDRAP